MAILLLVLSKLFLNLLIPICTVPWNESFDLFSLSHVSPPFLADRDRFLAPEDEAKAALQPFFFFLLVLTFIVSSRQSK